MPPVTWDSKISAVAGSAASKIEKAFGYRTVGDLLSHYPRRYVDKGKVSDLEHLTLDDHITFVGRVVRSQQKSYPDRRRGGLAYRLEVVVATEHDRLALDLLRQEEAPRRLAGPHRRGGEHRTVLGQGRPVPRRLAADQPADQDLRRGRGGRRRDGARGVRRDAQPAHHLPRHRHGAVVADR